MKKIILALFTMLFVSTSIFAQSDLQPIAVVKYNKSQTITVKDLKKRVNQISKTQPQMAPLLKTVDGRKQALDTMIKETLIIQAAHKAGYSVPESVIQQQMDLFLSQQVGAPITEKQFSDLVKQQYGLTFEEFFLQQTGITAKEYKELMSDQFLVNQYITSINQKEMAKVAATDEQIRMFYEANKSNFVLKDMAKLFIVSIPKGTDSNAAKTKANQLRNKLVDKKTTAEKIVVQAEAEGFQAGDMLVQKDQQSAMGIGMTMQQLLQLFTQPVGFVSDLIETPTDFQFFSLAKKYDAKMLGISDLVQPETTVTVYDYIRGILTQNLQMQFINNAMEKLADELNTPENVEMKKSGDALDKLLSWGE